MTAPKSAHDDRARSDARPEAKDRLKAERDEDGRHSPVSGKFVLIVEDDPGLAEDLVGAAQKCELKGIVASSGGAAISLVRRSAPAAIVLDFAVSDMDARVLLDFLRNHPETSSVPVHVLLDENSDLSGAEEAAGVSTSKRGETDFSRLFGTLAKRSVEKEAKGNAAEVPGSPRAEELAGRSILIVDDDIRNIFSLASVLETKGASVIYAERGADGIAMLRAKSGIDAALIDIMMPDMDGYETMRRIREDETIRAVPLIAVTAKAMQGDRQKCLDAGADDYISKPVDLDLLMSVLRVAFEYSSDRAVGKQTELAAK